MDADLARKFRYPNKINQKLLNNAFGCSHAAPEYGTFVASDERKILLIITYRYKMKDV